MLSERSLLFAFGGGFNSIDKQLSGIGSNLSTTPSPTAAAAAAAAYIYLEKVKEGKLTPQLTEASATKVLPEARLDSLSNAIIESAASNINSNCNRNPKTINHNSNNNNNIANKIMNNHVQNALGGSSSGLTISNTTNNHSHQQQSLHYNSQQHQLAQKQPLKAIASSIGHVKREGMSPGTNGDLQSSVSRSRSTTPSSFRGTSPQQISTETLLPLTSLLRVQQAASSERHNSSVMGATIDTTNVVSTNATLPTSFSTRNYSDIMRSLAAKYNDSDQNNSLNRRNIFYDTPSSACTAPVANKNFNQQTGNRNSAAAVLPSPLPKKDSQPQIMQPLPMSPGEVAVAAAAASFLSNLPFSQSVYPPLIDMSSTQALVTLARAAKEAEIQTILRYSQQNLKPINSTSILPHANLTVALQQATQFVSPALIYSAQLQQQHQTPSSRHSSPLHKLNNVSTNSNGSAQKTKSTAATSAATTPLDLSSQPPAAKRFKVELNTAGGSIESDGNVSIAGASSNLAIENNLFIRSSAIMQRTRSNTPEKCNDDRLSVSPASATARQSPVARQCQAQSEEVAQWTIDDVCAFVGDIDICADYVQHFRDQCIDGSGLPLLTEDHLLNALGMKLGPALKLRSMLAKKLGGPCPCVACIMQARQMLALQTASKNDAVRPRAASTDEPATAGGASTCERSSDIAITDAKDKEKQSHEDGQEGQQMQQVTEQRRTSTSSNNEGNSSCAALTLQICANIYKNEANSNNHGNEKVNNENKRSGENIVNKTAGSSSGAATDSIANKDCTNNSRNDGSSNPKNGSLQRTGSGDIADVGS